MLVSFTLRSLVAYGAFVLVLATYYQVLLHVESKVQQIERNGKQYLEISILLENPVLDTRIYNPHRQDYDLILLFPKAPLLCLRVINATRVLESIRIQKETVRALTLLNVIA